MPAFDIQVAVCLAEASLRAYPDEGGGQVQFASDVDRWTVGQGYAKSHTFDRDNTQGFFAMGDAGALLAFCGSDNLRHWLRDFKFARVRHPWGNVHCGFYDGWSAAVPEVEKLASDSRLAEQPLLITGHSLGGAIAVLATAWFRLNVPDVETILYTFGQPCVGDEVFASICASELRGRIWRVINQNDLIPTLPPESFGFRHCGRTKRIVNANTLESRSHVMKENLRLIDTEKPRMSEVEFERLLDEAERERVRQSDFHLEGRAMSLLSDHSIHEYVRLLRSVLRQQ